MDRFVIEGGHRIKGEMTPSGNKNEVLPAIAACILTEETVTLENVPRLCDVEVMLEVLSSLGGQVEWTGTNTISVCMKEVRTHMLDRSLCRRVRASVLFSGPMTARCGRVVLPPPGGDVIGRRRVDTLFSALESLGAKVEVGEDYVVDGSAIRGSEMFLDEASVTGTENVVMAACLAPGHTEIMNAACEPHVQGLCRMLNSMGARISGIGTNHLVIDGVDRLHGTTHRIGTDYLVVGSMIGLGAIMGDGLKINGVNMSDMRKIRLVYEKMGIAMEFGRDSVFVPAGQQPVIQKDMNDAIPQIDDAPWPAFPTDLMSIAIVTATQCSGTLLFFEKMFEGRMFFVDSLIGMGASIILCDPHRVVVVGPSRLYGTSLESPDVRAGMALLIASLCAQGRSVIHNIRQIDRGYERIDETLRSLGASIVREDDCGCSV